MRFAHSFAFAAAPQAAIAFAAAPRVCKASVA
jgi:hypothetical protein